MSSSRHRLSWNSPSSRMTSSPGSRICWSRPRTNWRNSYRLWNRVLKEMTFPKPTRNRRVSPGRINLRLGIQGRTNQRLGVLGMSTMRMFTLSKLSTIFWRSTKTMPRYSSKSLSTSRRCCSWWTRTNLLLKATCRFCKKSLGLKRMRTSSFK